MLAENNIKRHFRNLFFTERNVCPHGLEVGSPASGSAGGGEGGEDRKAMSRGNCPDVVN